VTDATAGEGANLWTRLRRRKVVQWGLAYAAGAWGLLQGLAYVTTTFHWPEQIQQLATLALLIGLPVVLVLAWFHGDKGHRRVTRTELAILTGLFLVGGGLFWRYQHTNEAASGATPPASITPTAAIANDNSIAVLPFVNMSDDKGNEYFSDGLSEELLNLLAQVPQLRVIARTSSFSFKGKEADIAEIANKLNVAHVLEGSVRKSGDTLRITAQLIRASDSSHLWSQTYDRPLTDVFKVQDEIAAAVVDQLKIKLLGSTPTARATDPKAYALYLQAREIHRQYNSAAFEQSIGLYRQALAIDPSYAAAWVGLATVYCDQVDIYLVPADEGIGLAREAAQRALALDPRNASAHARLGWIAIYYDRDLAEGSRRMEHALALEPANPDILASAAGLARRLGRLDLAIAIGEHLTVRDPLNLQGRFELATAHFYAGRLEEAIAIYRADLRLFPDGVGEHEMLGEALLRKGDAKAALVEIERERSESIRLDGLAMAYHALGRKAESDAALGKLIQKHERTMAWGIACAFAFRNEADQAFAWLNKAVEYQDPTVGSTAAYPLFTNLHSDPRWLPFLRKNGMAPEQLAAIKFDVKLPN
jgi:TolB-like protein/cytochrome c-type biogenesis protein CcmH/NrfG